jgi:hypothetical protein
MLGATISAAAFRPPAASSDRVQPHRHRDGRRSSGAYAELDFIPLFVEDYYLLGRRETIERADVEAIVTSLKSPQFAEHVRGIPGYDASRTGEVSNIGDVIG